MKTKKQFAERVIRQLQNNRPNIDFKIDEREVFLALDAVVNLLARQSYFENWKLSGASLDEQFITTWAGDNAISVVDQENDNPSYLILPASYVDLPNNAGIEEIWPLRYGENDNQSVIIMTHRQHRSYSRSKANNMLGRLSGYPEGDLATGQIKFFFRSCGVKKKFGEKFGVRLVIRDSAFVGDNAVYPVPADKEDFIIEQVIEKFDDRRKKGSDNVRDNQDVAA